jgi:hypothetical protein
MGCGLTRVTSVLFTAVDACDNSITTTSTFTIEDHMAPSIQTPASDATIECGLPGTQTELQNWLSNNGGAIATDVCGTVAWTNNFPLLPDTCNGTITEWAVLFTTSDGCGNVDATSAIVTLNDVLSGTSGSFPPGPGLHISPNPVSDILKVEFTSDKSSIERMILYDAVGHPVRIYQQIIKELYIPVNSFTPGLYYLQARTSHSVGIIKVIID